MHFSAHVAFSVHQLIFFNIGLVFILASSVKLVGHLNLETQEPFPNYCNLSRFSTQFITYALGWFEDKYVAMGLTFFGSTKGSVCKLLHVLLCPTLVLLRYMRW